MSSHSTTLAFPKDSKHRQRLAENQALPQLIHSQSAAALQEPFGKSKVEDLQEKNA